MYYGVLEIASIFLYVMAFALLESAVITGGLAGLSMILPGKWLREGLAYKGLLAVLVGSSASIMYQAVLGEALPSRESYLYWIGAPLIVLAGLILLCHKLPRLGQILSTIAERFTVFAYLYLPLGILGLIVVLARNIL
jgi:hypothetical protein